MRGLIAISVLLCAFQAVAGETLTHVAAVVESLKTERLLVLSGADGRVFKTKASSEMKKHLEGFKDKSVIIRFDEVGNEAILTGIELADARGEDVNFFAPNDRRQSDVTDVGSLAKATALFGEMNDGDKSRSQCFKRAHIWAYDMWTREAIVGQKIFIFYSKRYIQLEEFDWWFHVAPVVTAGGVEYVMDKTFLNRPVTIQEWKDKFMKNTVTCDFIEKYDQYESRPWNRLCFLMKTPMWYFRPADIRARDYDGVEKGHWNLMELQDARRAFKGSASEDQYEALDTGKRTVTH